MPQNIRIKNLHLARHLSDGLGKLAAVLGNATNEAALIKMGQGKSPISDDLASIIEMKLELPRGWMSRDNGKLIQMESVDAAIHKQIAPLSEETKKSLLSLLSSINK